MSTVDKIFIHVLGLLLMLASLYDSVFLTNGMDETTFFLGMTGIFVFWWPVVLEDMRG